MSDDRNDCGLDIGQVVERLEIATEDDNSPPDQVLDELKTFAVMLTPSLRRLATQIDRTIEEQTNTFLGTVAGLLELKRQLLPSHRNARTQRVARTCERLAAAINSSGDSRQETSAVEPLDEDVPF